MRVVHCLTAFDHVSKCLDRATAEELLKEYKACESPDYITYVRYLRQCMREAISADKSAVRRELTTANKAHSHVYHSHDFPQCTARFLVAYFLGDDNYTVNASTHVHA